MPGLKVVAPATPYDAKGLLKSAIRDEDPVIFMEGETLYGSKGEVPEEEYTIPIGVADVKRQGKDVTIVAWSKMVTVALKAADTLAADGISCEVIDPRTLRPLDDGPIVESVRKTNRCVILEEGWPYAGVGAQIAYQVQQAAFGDLDAPIARVTGARRADAIRQEPRAPGDAVAGAVGGGGAGSVVFGLGAREGLGAGARGCGAGGWGLGMKEDKRVARE